MAEWVRELAERVQKLSAEPGADRFFGARHHRYELIPVSEDVLHAFEAKHECRLPDDYRAWLLVAGRGAGPGNGLFLPGTWDTGGGVEAWSPQRYGPLATPFPYQASEDRHSGRLPGGMPICDLGCGMVALLVTAGPSAGEVWSDERAAGTGLHPEGLRFREWMQAWVHAVEREIAEPWTPRSSTAREPARYVNADVVPRAAIEALIDTIRNKVASSKSRSARIGKLGKFYARGSDIAFVQSATLDEALQSGTVPPSPPLSDAFAAVLEAGPGSALRLDGLLRIWLREGEVRVTRDYLGRESRSESKPHWAVASLMSGG